MANSIANSAVTMPDNLDVIGRPRMARADIGVSTALSPLIKEAARVAHGKQEAAARHLGKNPGNFSRDLDAGRVTVRDIEALGPEFLAQLGKCLTEQYGHLQDPKVRARQVVREAMERLRELEAFLEYVAS